MPRCPQCAAELPPQARFARNAAPASATPRNGAVRAFDRERRQVAVLFADRRVTRGYRARSTGGARTVAHALLRAHAPSSRGWVARSTSTRRCRDGRVRRPVAYGNDIERALRAAVDIHTAMARCRRRWRRPLGTQIGIASGEVVAAATRQRGPRRYTVTGDAVNLASRLTELAAGARPCFPTTCIVRSRRFGVGAAR